MGGRETEKLCIKKCWAQRVRESEGRGLEPEGGRNQTWWGRKCRCGFGERGKLTYGTYMISMSSSESWPLISSSIYAFRARVCVCTLWSVPSYSLPGILWDIFLRRTVSPTITHDSLRGNACACLCRDTSPCIATCLSARQSAVLSLSLPLLSVCGEWRDGGLNFNGAAISQLLLKEGQCRLTHSVSREQRQDRGRNNSLLDIHTHARSRVCSTNNR